jgi:type I restriction enzyme S subunit
MMKDNVLIPLKVVADLNKSALGENTDPEMAIKYIDISSVSKNGFSGIHQDFTFETAPSRARRKIKDGSTIIATVRTYLKAVAFFSSPKPNEIVSTGFAVLDPRSFIDPKYLYYRVAADDFVQQVEAYSVGVSYPAISPCDLGKLKLSLPSSIQYQKRLANYLDHKTAVIDKMIAAKNRLLDNLESAARATIFSITTKGLSNVSMIDSGEEWLGEVPASWKRTYLMGCGFELKKKNSPGNIITLLSLSYGKLITKDINDNGGLLPESFDTYQILKKGQTVLRLTDLQNDHRSLRVGYVEHDGMITSAYSCVTAKSSIDPKYLYYYLHSADLRKVFYSMGGGVRQSMKFDDLKRLIMYIPPTIEEQREIVEAVDAAVEKIVTLQKKVKHSIRLLEEYRSSLISNVVGGKVEA